MNYVIGALQCKLPRSPLTFNPALPGLRVQWVEHGRLKMVDWVRKAEKTVFACLALVDRCKKIRMRCCHCLATNVVFTAIVWVLLGVRLSPFIQSLLAKKCFFRNVQYDFIQIIRCWFIVSYVICH